MYTKKELNFIFVSCMFSVIHALGYLYLGIHEGFTLCILAMIILDLLYIPASLIKSIKLFPAYLIIFSVSLVFIISNITSKLFNNYSALLCIFIAILIIPKYKNYIMCLYLIVSAGAFCLAGDEVILLIIHYSRALWIFTIYDFIIYIKYERKPVILFEEEILILEQLTDNKLQKEIEINGLSDRTIRRRLDAAQKRNGLKNREELKELYINSYKKAK